MASDLADHIEAMVHAFPTGDSRRDGVRKVAAQVRALKTEVERLRAVQRAFVRDNRDKTNAVRELQAALAGVLRSFEAYALLCDPPEELDEYDEMMLPAWRRAASLVPGFDPKAPGAWVQEPTALEEA